MELKKYNRNEGALTDGVLNKRRGLITLVIVGVLSLSIISCDSFLEVDTPKNKLVSETVFEDAKTVESALANIYFKIREQGMVSGDFGLSLSIGIYADELDYYGTNLNQLNLYNHNITANDNTISSWWNHAYNLIYAANDIIHGMDHATKLSLEDQNRFKGQALFVRAFLHSMLVGLYGDIPYITTTDYLVNNEVSRMSEDSVYESIIIDLIKAVELLDDNNVGERIVPNRSAAKALLARIYLYHGDWALAETMATDLIETHVLEADIGKVFLKNATGTLWQLKPGGPNIINTQEGQNLIVNSIPTQGYGLTNNILDAFETGDLRRSIWVGSISSNDGLTTLYYAHKYKETIGTTNMSLEYSIVFRLAEQYLIRAEARAQLEDLTGAQHDINAIRNRAGLGDTSSTTKGALLEAILDERKVELFTEHGHRWFDLKRFGSANDVLGPIKPNWKPSDILLPIPGSELEVNPYLKPQNSGY